MRYAGKEWMMVLAIHLWSWRLKLMLALAIHRGRLEQYEMWSWWLMIWEAEE